MTATPATQKPEDRHSVNHALEYLSINLGVTARQVKGELGVEMMGDRSGKATSKIVDTLRQLGVVEGESNVDKLADFKMPASGGSVKIGSNVTVSAEEFGPNTLVRVTFTTEQNLPELSAKLQGAAHRVAMEDTAARNKY